MSCREIANRLPPVPESVRAVLCVLYDTQPLTMKELQERSGLARRTVYGALQRLRELGVIEERPSLQDTRQTLFWLDAAVAA